jgi:hypothetical protein
VTTASPTPILLRRRTIWLTARSQAALRHWRETKLDLKGHKTENNLKKTLDSKVGFSDLLSGIHHPGEFSGERTAGSMAFTATS